VSPPGLRRGLAAVIAGFLVGCLLLAGGAAAHEVRPALLEIRQTGPQTYQVFWKQPALGDVAIRLRPHLSSGWLETQPVDQYAAPGFLEKTWSIRSGTPLSGQTVSVEGLEQTITDVVVQASRLDGHRFEALLKPASPSTRISLDGPAVPHAPAYLKLGVEHILTGFDHLSFVLGLLLLVGVSWRIVKAATAFTAAHSLTLSAAALGVVHVPPPVVESLVALSIVFVAAELLPGPGREQTLTRRHPWLVAFVFGLLHGLAFAGALADIGLPPHAVALSLFLFNVGVEIGQLMFIAVAVAAILALRKVRAAIPLDLDAPARLVPPYAIGAFAAFWFIERVQAAFG
jgi:hydrogenase/urease accessory protein HupE